MGAGGRTEPSAGGTGRTARVPPTDVRRERPWRPWWAVLLALGGLASLSVPLFYSVLWIRLDRDLDLSPVDGLLAAFGRRGLVGSAVVALPWLLFLVRGGRTAFGAGLALTLLGWSWVAWGG